MGNFFSYFKTATTELELPLLVKTISDESMRLLRGDYDTPHYLWVVVDNVYSFPKSLLDYCELT